MRCLGIYIGHDKPSCYQKNWKKKIEKMKLVFERWKNRNLSIFGKSLIIKSLAASILVHTMSILDTPTEILDEIEKLIFGFLWEKNEKIKRKTLIMNKLKGGINMLDIHCKDKALKASWIKRLNKTGPNKSFINLYLNKKGINVDYLIKSNCTGHSIIKEYLKIPTFWAKVLL